MPETSLSASCLKPQPVSDLILTFCKSEDEVGCPDRHWADNSCNSSLATFRFLSTVRTSRRGDRLACIKKSALSLHALLGSPTTGIL